MEKDFGGDASTTAYENERKGSFGGADRGSAGRRMSAGEMAAEAQRRESVAVNLVENPLQRITPQKAASDARLFAEQKGMGEHANLFAKAALVARDPNQLRTSD